MKTVRISASKRLGFSIGMDGSIEIAFVEEETRAVDELKYHWEASQPTPTDVARAYLAGRDDAQPDVAAAARYLRRMAAEMEMGKEPDAD